MHMNIWGYGEKVKIVHLTDMSPARNPSRGFEGTSAFRNASNSGTPCFSNLVRLETFDRLPCSQNASDMDLE